MDNNYIGYATGAISVCILALIIIVLVFNKKVPSALDVYRGKTTLEITYKDDVAIDSVVVYK